MLRYFAYGSNMYLPRLRHRVPGCAVVSIARLPAHQLLFHKVSRKDGSAKCDAFHTGRPDDVIIGVLYDIPEAEKHDLDGFEGLGYGYEERRVQVILPGDTKIDAVAYVATPDAINAGLQPYGWYKDFVTLGAEEHALPADYVSRYIESAVAIEDPDINRDLDERGKLRF